MDVNKKIKLMLIMDSYWDMLPPEIHELILLYKRNQEMLHQEKEKRMRDLGRKSGCIKN